MRKWDCWDIKKQVLGFSESNSGGIRILSQDEQESIKLKFREKYIRKDVVHIGYSIFEKLKYEYAGIDVPDSWKWIKDFIGDNSIIVFFNESDEKDYFEFKNGSLFVEFYNSIPLVEFYIVDLELNYLLAYNHSQCLIAMGNAADWLENDRRYIERYESNK